MHTISFIGSGMISRQLARLAIAARYNVILRDSRSPDTVSKLVAELGEAARGATPAEAAQEADLMVASIPFAAYRKLPATELAGKIGTTIPNATKTCRMFRPTALYERVSAQSRLSMA